MIRIFFCFIVCFGSILSCNGQKKYAIQKGDVKFSSKASLELISASSSQVQGLIDPLTNQFAFSVDIKSFKGFNNALQHEHFNEKYLESDRYPKARFSGKIIEQIDFTQNATYEIRAKGELEIHGQKQTRIIRGRIITKDGSLKVETHFSISLGDHNISVPSIVSQKIAAEISVDFTSLMSLQ